MTRKLLHYDKRNKKRLSFHHFLEVKDLFKDLENLYKVNEQGMGCPSPSTTCQQNLIKR